MDGQIGPIHPSIRVTGTPSGTNQRKNKQAFRLESEESETDPEGEPSKDTHPENHKDLPVGHARFDESGRRLDTTA
ncbi:MAG: hypothetical protein R3F33_02440 [Planctomycetota bacterium]